MKIQSAIFATFVVALSTAGITACQKEKDSTRSGAASDNSGETPTDDTSGGNGGQLNVGQTIVNNVTIALQADAGLSADQSSAVTAGALQISTPSTALVATADPNNVMEIAPEVTGAIVTGLADSKAALSAEQKINAAQVIGAAVTKSLDTYTGNLSSDDSDLLPAIIAEKGIAAVKDAGLSKTQSIDALGNFMNGAVGKLGEAGFSAEKLTRVMPKMATYGMAALKQASFTPSEIPVAVGAFMDKSVSAFKNTGLKPDQMKDVLGPFVTDAVGSLSKAGLSNVSAIKGAIAPLMEGAVAALGRSGLNQDAGFNQMLGGMVTGAMAGFKKTNFAATDYTLLMDDLAGGVVSAFGKANLPPAQVAELVPVMSSAAVGYLGTIGISDGTNFKNAAANIATGAMKSLGKMQGGVMTAAQVQTATDNMTKATIDKIYTVSSTLGIADFTSLATGFAGGLTKGMANAGFSATDISGYSSRIGNKAYEALSGKGINSTVLDGYKTSVINVSEGFAQNLQVECESGFGTWDSATKVCRYPQQDPNAMFGAGAPPVADLDRCNAVNGMLLSKPGGGWFCQTVQSSSNVITQSACVTSGFVWIAGASGGYCQTTSAATNPCAAFVSAESCSQNSCSWDGNFCKESSRLSCYSFFNNETCSQAPGCVWQKDATREFCSNAAIVSCSGTTEAACAGTPGCLWNPDLPSGQRCVNASAINCGQFNGSANKDACMSAPGCFWDGASHCINGAKQSCQVHGTENACSLTPGCVWNGESCANSMNAACGLKVTEPTCSTTAGCTWDGMYCKNSAAIACGSNTDADACGGAMGCMWDGDSCMNAASFSCGDNTTMPTCNANPGCFFENNVCKNVMSAGCAFREDESSCQGVQGCAWNGLVCQSVLAVDCGSRTSTTCDDVPVCNWDPAGMGSCKNVAGVNCSQVSQIACNGTEGCFLDSTNACVNRSTLECPAKKTESDCENLNGCEWFVDGSNAFCRFLIPNATSCGLKDGQSVCDAEPGCYWELSLSTPACVQMPQNGIVCAGRTGDCIGTKSCHRFGTPVHTGSQCFAPPQLCQSVTNPTYCTNNTEGRCMWHSGSTTCVPSSTFMQPPL